MKKLIKRRRRRAFYPCCEGDLDLPLFLLRGRVDEILFCDKKRPASLAHRVSHDSTPSVRFVQGDVKEVIPSLPLIDILFYRRDSEGEGGSNVFILGKRWLPQIIAHFPVEGGLIVTDGSNSGGGLFRKMIRPEGYIKKAWGVKLKPSTEQPWLEQHGLHLIEVTRTHDTLGEIRDGHKDNSLLAFCPRSSPLLLKQKSPLPICCVDMKP